MIPAEDWKAANMPGFAVSANPRRFKWSYKDFKKAMKGKRLKRAQNFDAGDRLVILDMQMMHGGRYWPTSDGGLIALPYDSKKFDFKEWLEEERVPPSCPTFDRR